MPEPPFAVEAAPAAVDKRVAAVVLDWLLAGVVFLLLVDAALILSRLTGAGALHAGGRRLALIAVVAAALVLVALAVLRGGGGSPGMRVLGLLLVRAADGTATGPARALARSVVFGVTAIIVVGVVSPLFDPRRRGWHDRASGTYLIERPSRQDELLAGRAEHGSADLADPISRPVPPPPLPVSTLSKRGTPAVSPTLVAPPDGAAPAPGAAMRRDVPSLLIGDRHHVLAPRTLLGRNPSPDLGDSDHYDVLAVDDRSLSKTHALIEVVESSVYVTDRWSLNGTTVVRDGRSLRLQPGERARVPEGARIRFGTWEARVGRSSTHA